MSATRLLSRALQALPPGLRKTAYSLLGLVGAVLAVVAAVGVEEIGPVTLTRALEVYAGLSAATGGVALANVSAPAPDGSELVDLGEDADLSSFEPVGHVDDVFGTSPA